MNNIVKQTPRIGEGKPGPGRPKGIANKTTTILKDALIIAAEAAGGGGDEGLVAYLTEQAKANPGPFLGLLGKVLPLQIAGSVAVQVTRIELVAPGHDDGDDNSEA